MKKLKLNLSDLSVETFELRNSDPLKKGTVKGNVSGFPDCVTDFEPCPTDRVTCNDYTCLNTCNNTCANTCGNDCHNHNTRCLHYTCIEDCWFTYMGPDCIPTGDPRRICQV